MDRATLDGIPGSGEVRIRRRSETTREFRGVFAFPREHEETLKSLLASGAEVEYQGLIDGRRRRLRARVTDVSVVTGLAYFQGLGDPFENPSAESAD